MAFDPFDKPALHARCDDGLVYECRLRPTLPAYCRFPDRCIGGYFIEEADSRQVVAMSVKDDVIKAMKDAGKPMSAGEVEKATGIDRKEIDKAFKELKAEGAIVSPVRCKWEPAQ